MGTNASSDLDQYTRLLDSPSPRAATSRRPLRGFVVILASVIFLISIIGLIINQNQEQRKDSSSVSTPEATSFPKVPRGVAEGVSTKSNPSFVKEGDSFNWTNAMFSWQRTAYHFQPERNWMNGPLYYKGWYHLFYQYNPDSAVWGNITWGHAVSTDLIHWLYLPIAMVPNEWYDINGVWTGSATLLPDGQIVMLYTGDTNELVQVQNLAWPANLSDPLLLHWVKYPDNPVMVPPPGIGLKDFRDPTTAWMGSDGFWRLIIGSKVNKTGIALVYKTANFTTYELLDHYLHEVPGTGMWECVDFYPVATIPRTVLFDNKTGVNLLEWPVEEIETLRLNRTDVKDIEVGPGSVVPIDIGTATQLDILAEFEIQLLTETVNEDRSCGGGAAERSILGPFGLLVIADASLSELTPVFFRPVNKSDGSPKTYFCADETRSSLAPEVMKRVYGGTVPVLADERFQMRVLVSKDKFSC
ncbi:vacuolar invertase [Tripterygium wilfordii]|uniref:beta-fructofuranosidase n=1 Tax=Tripterygium wilfordii TaxID=458696 RepID=A0A7J7CAF0_TRIWF|nr:vacuolar invertase [Tripterygium wilfordii]